MKILHVEGGSRLYGGAQQVLYLLEGLAKRGQSNLLACPAGSALAARAASFAEVHPMPMGGDLDLTTLWRLRRLIAATKPDLIHLHSRIGVDVMGGLAALGSGIPVVHTRRVDNPEPGIPARLKYRLHDRVVAISEGIGEVLRGVGVSPGKLRVVRSAVMVEHWQRRCDRAAVLGRLGLAEDRLLIGVIAQLIPRKGHALLLDVLAQRSERLPPLWLLFFGEGRERQGLGRQIDELGLGDRVRLEGFRDDLRQIVPCLDLVVHPATMEGLGVSLLQSTAAGVPILASAAGGIPEVVRDGENGLLVPPRDHKALGDALERLLGDGSLRRRLGDAGRELARRELSVDAMVEGNLAVYRELLS